LEACGRILREEKENVVKMDANRLRKYSDLSNEEEDSENCDLFTTVLLRRYA
jgi:hypothetical protein